MPKDIKGKFNFTTAHCTYKWDNWLDGKTREFFRGDDFNCELDAFRKQAYNAAKIRGLKVRTHIDDEKQSIVICSFEDNHSAAKSKRAKASKNKAGDDNA